MRRKKNWNEQKLAPPFKEGKVLTHSGFIDIEIMQQRCRMFYDLNGNPIPGISNPVWRNDPDYFAAERVRVAREKKRLDGKG